MSCSTLLMVCLLGAPAPAPQSGDHPMTPFVNAETMLVGYVDITKLDIDAAEAHAKKLGVPLPPDAQKQMKEAKKNLDALKSAGVVGCGVAVEMASFQAKPPAGVMFLAKGTDAKAAIAKIKKLDHFGEMTFEPTGSAVAFGMPDSVDALKSFKPSPRPELAAAMKVAGGESVSVVIMPPDEPRKMVESMMPTLPPPLGGGPITALTQDVKWIALSMDAGKQIVPRIVIQAKDAAAAKAVKAIADAGMKFVKEAKMPDAEPAKAALDVMVITLKDDQLHIGVDNKKVEAMVGPAVEKVRIAADRTVSQNNLKQLALAVHNYADAEGRLPADICDKNGKPLLSYRVLLLPYVEQEQLHKQFKLDEPWDSDHNKKLIAQMPKLYRSPFAKSADGTTTYLGASGKDYLFDPAAKGKGRRFQDITDGTSNTVMFIETGDDLAVEWTKPADWKPDVKNIKKGLARPGVDGFNVAFCDGSVRFFRANLNDQSIADSLTINGGEIVDFNK